MQSKGVRVMSHTASARASVGCFFIIAHSEAFGKGRDGKLMGAIAISQSLPRFLLAYVLTKIYLHALGSLP